MCDRGGIGRRASLRSWYHRCVSSSLTGRTISGRGAEGSAPDWGSGGRLFKSDRSDHMGRRKVSTALKPKADCAVPRGSTEMFHHYAGVAQRQSVRLVSEGQRDRHSPPAPVSCYLSRSQPCGCNSMAEFQLPKLVTWVRLPSPAPNVPKIGK